MLGVVCLVTGILAMVWPGITLLTLGILLGIYLLVSRSSRSSTRSSASPAGGR